jgi:diguanylate cyclase (GGDEF)-like protein/PAS domain S-box-containing protein
VSTPSAAVPEPRELDYRAVVDALQSFSTILALSDGDNRIMWVNTAATVFLGRSAEDLVGRSVLDLLVAPARETAIAGFDVAGADDGPYGEHEFEFERSGEPSVWGLVRTIRLKNVEGRTSQRMSVIEDVTARHLGTARETLLEADLRTAEVANRNSQAVIGAAIAALPVAFAVFDTDLRLTSIAGRDQAGIRFQDDIGRTASQIIGNPDALQALIDALGGAESTSRTLAGGETFLALNAPMRDDQGAITGVISVRSNVTAEVSAGDKRRQAEGLALFIARHDPLTGLLQRSALIEELAESAFAGHGARALMIVDLDDFNAINDCLGHAVGDAVILEVASRLSDAFPGLLVARYGGDQFAVVASFVVDRDVASQAAETVRALLDADVEVSGQTVRVTASIGIALQEVRESSSTLVRNADAALARAKHAGPGQYRVYDDEMRRRNVDRLQIKDGLRVALSAGQLRLVYQPIVRLADRRILGAEALLRWTHPVRGAISPVEFIPVAEQNGLIVPIGGWVMTTACHDMLALQRRRPLYVSVNASTRQLAGGRFAELVEETLERTGLPAAALIVEVTEGALNHDLRAVSDVFEQLRSHGVRVAIDDFGTGFSSLARLQGLPVDVIKLDRAFVTDVDTRSEARGMAAAILQLGSAIGADVIAEGVETEGEATTLLDLGYALGQGFLFARPMPFAAMSELLGRAGVSEGVGPLRST